MRNERENGIPQTSWQEAFNTIKNFVGALRTNSTLLYTTTIDLNHYRLEVYNVNYIVTDVDPAVANLPIGESSVLRGRMSGVDYVYVGDALAGTLRFFDTRENKVLSSKLVKNQILPRHEFTLIDNTDSTSTRLNKP